MGLWGRTLRGGIWIQSWKKWRREPSRYLGPEPSSKEQKQKSTQSTVRRLVWLEGNEKRWGQKSGHTWSRGISRTSSELLWELRLLVWIMWRHPAFRLEGSRKLCKWRAKSPRISLLLWIQLLTSSWANQMFPAPPPEGSTFCRHRKHELGYVPLQVQSNPARGQSGCFAWKKISILLSMLSSWVKTRLASIPRENLGPKTVYICLDRDKPGIPSHLQLEIIPHQWWRAPPAIWDVFLNLCRSQFSN